MTGRSTKPPCVECGNGTWRTHPILHVPLCSRCRNAHRDRYGYITKTRALKEYRLKPSDLARIESYSVKNPHYSIAAPMQLYLHAQVCQVAAERWGSPEPYTVTLVRFPAALIEQFRVDPERMKELSPRDFQELVADRLNCMGLSVQMVGDVYRKDGGIDIIACPKVGVFPFLLGVQVKHHRTARKTGAPEVRQFHGAITSSGTPFSLGVVVTNTTFTPDAKWFAERNCALLRLRDFNALRRWLQEDFDNDNEWCEVPDEIEIAPGIAIAVPKRTLVIPR